MIDCIRVRFIERIDIFDIFSDIIYPRSKEQYFNLEPTFLVVLQMQEMLSDTLPINVIAGCFAELDAEVYLLSIEDVLYPELDLELEEGVEVKVVLDLVLHHYLHAEGEFYLGVSVCCCCD